MSISLGLERISKLLSHIPYTRPTIHVGGTNGKGSVSTLIEFTLRESGLRVGKFTSPHLIHVRDSICIDGDSLSAEDYERIAKHVQKLSDEHSIGASLFELLTATALYAFEEANLDVVVLEVGMGGRLDATNALRDEVILISVITAIDLDHQAFLGSTVREITLEKAGIIRDGCLVALGDQTRENEQDVLSGVESVTVRKRATLIRATPVIGNDTGLSSALGDSWVTLPSIDPSITASYPLRLALLGAHQRSNARLAHVVLKALHASHPKLFGHLEDAHIKAGFERARWPGRLSWHTVSISPPGMESRTLRLLVDGAHNAASAAALASYLRSFPVDPNSSRHSAPSQPSSAGSRQPYTFILAMSHSPLKTPLSVLSPLLHPGDRVAIVKFVEPVEGMPWVKNVQTEDLLKDIKACVGDDGVLYSRPPADNADSNPGDNLRDALQWASEQADVAVLAGSLYLVGDLYRYCQLGEE